MRKIPLRNRAGQVVAHALVDSADFTWLNQWRWFLAGTGYAVRFEGRRAYLMHRVILGLDFGDRREGDHDDWDKLNNQRANLVARGLDEHRRRKRGRNIRRVKSGWRAFGWDGRRQVNLGVYVEEAAALQVAADYKAARA